jgi:hypothetical protein
MLGEFDLDTRLQGLVARIVESYTADSRTRHIGRGYLPTTSEIVRITEMLLEISYPGYFGRQDLSEKNIAYHVGELLPRLGQALYMQIFRSLCHQNEIEGNYDPNGSSEQALPIDTKARELTEQFLARIVSIREMLALDVQAAYDGDPAAVNTDEVIMAYPGLLAITVYRHAHELYLMNVPVMPRTMTEWAHQHRYSPRRDHRQEFLHRPWHGRSDRRDNGYWRQRETVSRRDAWGAVVPEGRARTNGQGLQAAPDGAEQRYGLRQRHYSRR